ncbi:unnamed protein product [Paramecium sonneborni]|uniref:TFIIS central domain-containing protein n=1 Tax=Paramecium sonneborni TaxID=65129 RepID=A0A8S1RBQ9_9CILI|nr:unnamed protein product [Paramecium sonneborni]
MIQETRIANRLQQDKKIRQNQISELFKIFEDDQIQTDIAQSFSNELEQAAFNLSGGENTREYRTRLNTVKIRLNGTKGQFIRSVLLQKIMTPLELMAFDMSKLNENSIQLFLEQNNRQIPQKNISNILTQKIQMDKDTTQNSNEKLKELYDDSKGNTQQEQNKQLNEQKFNQQELNNNTEIQSEIKQKQNNDQITTIADTDKIYFAPQEEPIQQFEEFIDYSFEYNQKQRDFVEGNDFPNIEELQMNEIKKNNQQEDQFVNSPLPSDNVLNQEFLQDDPQDVTKENVQTKILDSQIQEEEQKYYDHECSFQIQEQKLIDAQKQNQIQEIDHQLAEFAAVQTIQQNQNLQPSLINHLQDQKQESNNLHIQYFEQQIYQKKLEQHQHEQNNVQDIQENKSDIIEELPHNYEEFFSFITKRDQQFEKQIQQLLDQNKTLTEQFYNMQIENQVQQENLEIQNLNQKNIIQQLINENNLLKLTFQQNEQQQEQLLTHLKEQALIEKAQFQKVYQNQLQNQQKHRQFLEQIRFNLEYRRDTVIKLKQSNLQGFGFHDEISQIQELLVKNEQLDDNYQVNCQTNENQIQTIGTVINADSGSTQIRRFKEALNQEYQDENEQNQLESEIFNQGQINQTRNLQQGIDIQNQNYNLEQERDQQQENQVKNKRINNIKQNSKNRIIGLEKDEQSKGQQVKRCNVGESLFD